MRILESSAILLVVFSGCSTEVKTPVQFENTVAANSAVETEATTTEESRPATQAADTFLAKELIGKWERKPGTFKPSSLMKEELEFILTLEFTDEPASDSKTERTGILLTSMMRPHKFRYEISPERLPVHEMSTPVAAKKHRLTVDADTSYDVDYLGGEIKLNLRFKGSPIETASTHPGKGRDFSGTYVRPTEKQ